VRQHHLNQKTFWVTSEFQKYGKSEYHCIFREPLVRRVIKQQQQQQQQHQPHQQQQQIAINGQKQVSQIKQF
jgi:hypothetical protein